SQSGWQCRSNGSQGTVEPVPHVHGIHVRRHAFDDKVRAQLLLKCRQLAGEGRAVANDTVRWVRNIHRRLAQWRSSARIPSASSSASMMVERLVLARCTRTMLEASITCRF